MKTNSRRAVNQLVIKVGREVRVVIRLDRAPAPAGPPDDTPARPAPSRATAGPLVDPPAGPRGRPRGNIIRPLMVLFLDGRPRGVRQARQELAESGHRFPESTVRDNLDLLVRLAVMERHGDQYRLAGEPAGREE